jgi:hypothetical protein
MARRGKAAAIAPDVSEDPIAAFVRQVLQGSREISV